MFEWLAANAATVIIGGMLLVSVIFAARHVFGNMKKGGCAGCGGCCENQYSDCCGIHTDMQK